MVTPIHLSLVAAATVTAGWLMVQPAVQALTAIAQPHAMSIDEGREDAAQLIGQNRYHRAKCDYRHGKSRSYCRSRQKPSYYRPQHKSGYHKPWTGHEPCANCPAIK